jgi:hypothetical protein
MFMALELDRANIQQALTDKFLTDLKMNTNSTSIYSWFTGHGICADSKGMQITISATSSSRRPSSAQNSPRSWSANGSVLTGGSRPRWCSGPSLPWASFGSRGGLPSWRVDLCWAFCRVDLFLMYAPSLITLRACIEVE